MTGLGIIWAGIRPNVTILVQYSIASSTCQVVATNICDSEIRPGARG